MFLRVFQLSPLGQTTINWLSIVHVNSEKDRAKGEKGSLQILMFS